MPQINATLSEATIEKITLLAKTQKQSFSKMISDLIDQGLERHENNGDKNLNPRVQAVMDRQAEYLLRMVNLCNEIYRFTFNDKSQFHDTDVEAAISAMNQKIKNHLYGDELIEG